MGLVGETLPLAIAIAASPFPVIPAILLLFTPRARATSLAFLGGWFVGVLAVVLAFTLLADLIEMFDEPPTWASVARIVIGLALIAWGIRKWATRHAKTDLPPWMSALDSATPGGAVQMALLLSAANPKILLLAGAAGLILGSESPDAATLVITAIVFTVISSIGVAIPVLLYAIRGDKVLRPLGRARDWLQRNNSAVMAVVFIVIGVVLAVKGAASL
jgi:threonine/homoserine/homoserine lactone efflux protein